MCTFSICLLLLLRAHTHTHTHTNTHTGTHLNAPNARPCQECRSTQQTALSAFTACTHTWTFCPMRTFLSRMARRMLLPAPTPKAGNEGLRGCKAHHSMAKSSTINHSMPKNITSQRASHANEQHAKEHHHSMPKSSTINYGEAAKRITACQRAARLITACQRAARLIMGRLQSASQHGKEQHD